MGGIGSTGRGTNVVNLENLGRLLWQGGCFEYPQLRAHSWRTLMGIAPNARER
jgi:hypothetical protein